MTKNNKFEEEQKFLDLLFGESKKDLFGFYDLHVLSKKYKVGTPKMVDFLKKIKKNVVYIHASAYDGQEEHHGLDKGKLDWRGVLNQLDFSKIRKIIIELHYFKDFKKTKKVLDDYLKLTS